MPRSALCGFKSTPGVHGADLLVQIGPTMSVDVGFDPTWKVGNATGPVPGITNINALVDTGAIESCIDALLATNLGLPLVDRMQVSGAHGAHPVNGYVAQIHLLPPLNFTIYGRFAGVHLAAGGQAHQVLLGRTLLRHFTLFYDGTTGNVLLTIP